MPGVAHALVGRDADLDRLDAAMDEVRAAGPGVVLCSGAVGAGKTTYYASSLIVPPSTARVSSGLGRRPSRHTAVLDLGAGGGATPAVGIAAAFGRSSCDRRSDRRPLTRGQRRPARRARPR